MSRTLKDEDLTKELALYKSAYGTTFVFRVSESMDESVDYAQVSEVIDVTFTPLSDEVIVTARVKSIDAEIDKTRAEMNLKINDLKDQKQRLLAITHE